MGCELFASVNGISLKGSVESPVLYSNLLLSSSVEGDFLYQELQAELSGSLEGEQQVSLLADLTGSLEASIDYTLDARFCWDDLLECGSGFAFSGGTVYPVIFQLGFGADTGTVTIDFEAFTLPDRAIVYYNGAVVLDTKYRGSQVYNNIGVDPRNGFAASLLGLDDPITGLTYPNTSIPDTLSDGYPKVFQNTSFTFNKSLYQITGAELQVYGPLGNTEWEIDISCPV